MLEEEEEEWCSGLYDVLLIKRAKDPLKGHWSLPGGHVECGEQSWRAGKRELFEETKWPDELHTRAEFSFSKPFAVVDAISFDGSARQQDRSDANVVDVCKQLKWHFLIVEVCAFVRCREPTDDLRLLTSLLDQVSPADDASEARWVPVNRSLRVFDNSRMIDEVPDVVYRATMLHHKGMLEWVEQT